MNILVLVAGNNTPSNSATLAQSFVEGMRSTTSTDSKTIYIKDLNIEHFSIDFYEAVCKQEEDFCRIQQEVQKADGIVIATPIWNFGVPAHLKNLIDRFGSFALDESRSNGTLNGLPFYLIFTGGAPYAAWKGMMQKTTSFLPRGLEYFGASYIGHHYEGKCTKGPGRFGLVVDERPNSLAAVRKQGATFAEVVKTYAETGKAPAKNRIKSKIMQWGERFLKKIT